MIYHVTTYQQWADAQKNGFYEAPSLQSEGFIHCSKKEQVKGVLQRYYEGKTDLIVLEVDESKLKARMIYEMSPSVNEDFPHIYGRLNLDAVTSIGSIHDYY
jgi:uncharacterized protein (DUF952 family)